jgi:hypothetical protein
MTTNIYHVTSDVAPVSDYNDITNFLDKWELSIEPTLIDDNTHPLHTGNPIIGFNSEHGPPLMITHKNTDSKNEHEFYLELSEHITAPMVITEKQIHPTTEENNIHILPENEVKYI